MASSVERRRALHAATRVHELTAEVAARSDARGGGGAAGGSRFSERERRLLERAAAAGPAPEVSALQSQQHGMEPEPSAAADLLPLENELQQEPVAMQRVGLTPCHVVRDYGYDDSVTAHEQISFSGTHTVTVGHLPLRRGELVMVTALSVEGSMLHGYVHEAANTIGDVTSGHRGRAGIFPRDSVIQLLDVPDEARVSRSWPGTGQNAELHLVNGDRITVTAKGGLCSSPGDAGTEAIWYGYCHRTGVAGFFPAECVDIPTDSELVIEVVGATRLPLINAETADPTVRMTLVDSHGRPKGRQRRSQPKKNSANPVWHCYRDFGVHASPTDRVVIEVFDNAESHFVGSVWMRVDELPLIPSAVGLSRNATVLPDGGDRGDGGGGQLVAARSGLDLQIELAERNHRQPQLQPLSLETATRAASEPMLTLRRVPNLRAGAHKRMRMIFIRHGESQWNAGQAESHQVRLHALGGLWKMFSQTDHPLSETGVAQASTANRNWQKQHLAMKGGLKALSTSQDDWVRAFLNAGRVYSSPLTRAVETCLLSLRGHPTLKQRGVSLISSAREVKNLGGQDTVGCAVGEGITARVQEELSVMIGEEEAAAILTEHGSIDAFDASTEWWTSTTHADSVTADMPARYFHFLSTLRYNDQAIHVQPQAGKSPPEGGHEQESETWHWEPDAHTAIVVGHSLWFRNFCRRFMSDEQLDSNELAAQLGQEKLCNAGIAGVELDFSQGIDCCKIVDCTLLFGSKLLGKHGGEGDGGAQDQGFRKVG